MSTIEEDDLRSGLRTLTENMPPVRPMAARAITMARTQRARRRAALSAGALVAVAGVSGVVATSPSGRGPNPVPAPYVGTWSIPAADPASGQPGPGTNPAIGPDRPMVGEPYRYDLYVHCGVRFATFGGRWWHAEPEQARPAGQPYRDGNYVTGTMTLLSPDHARFVSADPDLTVDFRPLTTAPAPCL
jgi:hypothetical protein